jgi:hypothetical protein
MAARQAAVIMWLSTVIPSFREEISAAWPSFCCAYRYFFGDRSLTVRPGFLGG